MYSQMARGRPKTGFMDPVNEVMKVAGVRVEDGEDRDKCILFPCGLVCTELRQS